MEQQLSSIPAVSGEIVAFDWHQATDTYWVSKYKAFRTDWETGELPQSVLDAFQQTAHNCGQFDQVIVLSHIYSGEPFARGPGRGDRNTDRLGRQGSGVAGFVGRQKSGTGSSTGRQFGGLF